MTRPIDGGLGCSWGGFHYCVFVSKVGGTWIPCAAVLLGALLYGAAGPVARPVAALTSGAGPSVTSLSAAPAGLQRAVAATVRGSRPSARSPRAPNGVVGGGG